MRIEACDAGGWKAWFDDFDAVADRIRDTVEPQVDTANMLVFRVDQVKVSFARSSGVMTVHTEDRDEAEAVIDTLMD